MDSEREQSPVRLVRDGRLRREGDAPGVVYGRSISPAPEGGDSATIGTTTGQAPEGSSSHGSEWSSLDTQLIPLPGSPRHDLDTPFRALMRFAPRLSFLGLVLLVPLLTSLAAVGATVISVGDGDTLRILDGGRKLTIRVACIDAPEMAQSPYGQQARDALQVLLPVGSTVTLKAQTKDGFGRTVAEVFAQSGANAGLTLVQQGHAFAYRQYLPQCDAWAYLDREKLAERYRLGVWRSAGGIERPWDFRAARRGRQSQPVARPKRPVNLTIINPESRPSAGRRWYCRTVASWEHAQQLLREGHTYLDGDSDGEACEILR